MKIRQILNRIYIPSDLLDASIRFYEEIFATPVSYRFFYSEANLELASVGSFLLIAGSEEALAPFTATKATFLVDSLTEWKEHLLTAGAKVIVEPQSVPTGWNMLIRHPDQTLIEYVQHTQEKVDAANKL